MGLMKALAPSTILTLIVAAVVGSAGSNGGFLALERFRLAEHTYYWSWPFFLTVMAINGILIARISKDVRI